MSYGVKVFSVDLLTSQTTTATGETHEPFGRTRSFSAYGSTSGAGAVVATIEVSNNNSIWLTLGSISLTLGTSVTQDGFSSETPWRYVRAKISSISGTNATVTVNMGTA